MFRLVRVSVMTALWCTVSHYFSSPEWECLPLRRSEWCFETISFANWWYFKENFSSDSTRKHTITGWRLTLAVLLRQWIVELFKHVFLVRAGGILCTWIDPRQRFGCFVRYWWIVLMRVLLLKNRWIFPNAYRISECFHVNNQRTIKVDWICNSMLHFMKIAECIVIQFWFFEQDNK